MTRLSQGRTEPKPRPHDCGCQIDIHIESRGDVNIYNCSTPAPAEPRPEPCPPPEACPPCPTAPGACVPLALGAKPKQSLPSKLQSLLANNPVPNALAASFFQLSRRFLAGKAAANPFEAEMFGNLRALSPDLRGILACALNSFDSLSPAERDRLYLPTLGGDADTPVDPGLLADAVSQEIAERASFVILGDPNAVEQERPGQNRFFQPDVESFEIQLRVCRVNGLRTNEFAPALGPGDYEPAELDQICEPVLVGDHIELNCQTRVGNCRGNFLTGNICLAVPKVQTGQAVVLEGVNFISVDTTVRLAAQAPGTATAEVEAHVFGDLDTPRTEIVDGQSVIVRDCRVHDRLTFKVPDDLPPGVYSVQLAVPNVSGFPVFGDPILSNFQFIEVVPPDTARFQIVLEQMHCREETSPAFFGSDEVGLSVFAAALLSDGTTTSLQILKGSDGKDFVRFGDVDSGNTFPINRVVFSHQQTLLGMAMAINGYEIDSEDAFEKQIKDFQDALLNILEKEWDFIKAAVAAAGGLSALLDLGWIGAAVIGAAAVITFGIDLIIAAWAPADPIMHDAIGLTASDLSALTSLNAPAPDPREFETTDDIEVKVTPLDKLPQQFRERREYISDDEDSRYELTLRYNRVA